MMKQYLIRIQLRDFNLAHAEAIMVAIIDEWFFRLNDYETEPRILEFVGDGLLAIPAEHFADRITVKYNYCGHTDQCDITHDGHLLWKRL